MKVFALSTKRFYTDGPGVVHSVFSTSEKALEALLVYYPNAIETGLMEGVWRKYEDTRAQRIIYITEYEVL